ncbi:MAG: hypothetical protein Q4D45_02735 [Lachnospiraceae bacterium]|nr:hypothetical protein [Lachnospiraceae bacterium]
MRTKYVVDIMIVFFFLVAGYTQIAKGTAYGISEQRYTKASIIKFSKPMGLITWLFAIALGIIFLGQSGLFAPRTGEIIEYVGDAVIVLVIILYYITSRKILEKKKAPMKYTYKKNKRKL